MTLGDLSALAKETGSRSLLRHEAKVHDSEIELFTRLQDKNDQVEDLKRQLAELQAKHIQEKQKLHAVASQQIEHTSSQAGELIQEKASSIEELSLQLNNLLTNGQNIVDKLEGRLLTGKHFPNRLPPNGLLEPVFRAPEHRPELPKAAQNLGVHEYAKLQQVQRAAGAPLPGDQQVLTSIRTATSRAHELLQPTDSPETEARCIEILRSVVRFVLKLREQVSWGDYVRPSMQHVEGPDLSVFNSVLNPQRSLASSERSELEALAAQQDSMADPLGVLQKCAALQRERAEELNAYDEIDEEIESVDRVRIHVYRTLSTDEMHRVRQAKQAKLSEFDQDMSTHRSQLTEMTEHLHDVLHGISQKLIDINESDVNRAAVVDSLEKDEQTWEALEEDIRDSETQLDQYKSSVAARKEAISVMGVHEVRILEHIEGLLTAGARALFEGNKPLLMRQFEVLPDVYCHCALLEDLY